MIKTLRYSGKNLEGLLFFLHSLYSSSKYSSSIFASASSTLDSYYPSNAVDFNPSLVWHPSNYDKPGEYLQVEIKSGWIEVDGYSIQTSRCGKGCANPKNWGFTASKDGNKWTSREDYTDTNGEMNGALASKYVPVRNKGIFKFFRFVVTGNSYETSDPIRMVVNQVEFFGRYYEGKYPEIKTSNDNKMPNICKISLIILLAFG